MAKKLIPMIFAAVLIASTIAAPGSVAASVSNGIGCSKAGASVSVKAKSLTKVYLCTGNPSITGAKGLEWTLKSCLSFWASAKNSQDAIDQQRSLVSSMSEPDKTNYGKQLDASQAQLDKVKVAIINNHCKKGL
jgi:hypothetical protein